MSPGSASASARPACAAAGGGGSSASNDRAALSRCHCALISTQSEPLAAPQSASTADASRCPPDAPAAP
eukprot:4286516-Prymnesium_polylepis.1